MPKKTERGAREATPCLNGNTKRGISQEEKILEYMRRKGSITSMEAFNDLHITRLSGRIFDLRESGYNIETLWETNQYGSRYGRYVLQEEAMA